MQSKYNTMRHYETPWPELCSTIGCDLIVSALSLPTTVPGPCVGGPPTNVIILRTGQWHKKQGQNMVIIFAQ
eukprot:8438-Heterococcus_DN1.PRE.1